MSLELNSPLRKQMTRMKMSNVTKGTVPLVHTYLDSEYIKVGEENDFEASSSNYQQMLNDLTYRDDGELTQVHAKRKQYGADIVNLWVNVGGYCGLAWGIQHDRENDPDIRISAYGWQDPDERFRTIMAYGCANQTCGSKVQRFSAPDVTYYDEAIGDKDNDNGKQLALSWDAVASFQPVGGTDESEEEENDYVIQIFSELDLSLCMVAKGEGSDSSVGLGEFQECNSFRMDENGLIRAFKQGGDVCFQAGHGKSVLDGSKMRFYPCDSTMDFQQFDWNDENGPIKLKSEEYKKFCFTSQGTTAEVGDGIKMKVCHLLRPVVRQEWFGD